jgi:hypothetical protein
MQVSRGFVTDCHFVLPLCELLTQVAERHAAKKITKFSSWFTSGAVAHETLLGRTVTLT